MDMFLDRLTQHAINYAIRSGISIAAGMAMQHTTRLIKNIETSEDRIQLERLQNRLQVKIKIISPAIDMIELVSARGNTTLESAVELTSTLRQDIASIAQRLEKMATEQSLSRQTGTTQGKESLRLEVKIIIADLKLLLEQIEDAVPFLNLAITTSGARTSTNMPKTISPSRLLQASTFLVTADTRFLARPACIQVGPTFTLSMFMLFAGHVRPQAEDDVRASIWKEVIHKARLKLMRVPLNALGSFNCPAANLNRDRVGRDSRSAEEFAYQLHIIEDLDDDRIHTLEEGEQDPEPFEDVARAGIREVVPIHQISKIFYADTGKVLNIGNDEDGHRPILLLKRNLGAISPQGTYCEHERELRSHRSRLARSDIEGQNESASDYSITNTGDTNENTASSGSAAPHRSSSIPAGLDPEWLAFEIYTEQPDSSGTSDDEEEKSTETERSTQRSVSGNLIARLQSITLGASAPGYPSKPIRPAKQLRVARSRPRTTAMPQIQTSLSLLEVLVRLGSLQQFRQTSHLSIEDEFLNFFLSEPSFAGAADGGGHERPQRRNEARKRVGFDLYDESLIEKRGECYQYHAGRSLGREGSIVEDNCTHGSLHSLDTPSLLPPIEGSDRGFQLSPRNITTSQACQPPVEDLPPLRSMRSLSDRLTPTSSPASSVIHKSLSPLSRRDSGLQPNLAAGLQTSSQTSLEATGVVNVKDLQ